MVLDFPKDLVYVLDISIILKITKEDFLGSRFFSQLVLPRLDLLKFI